MDNMDLDIRVVINEYNVNYQIDIPMKPIIYSMDGKNKIVWRSMDPKYRLQVWKYENEDEIFPENVQKDDKIISTAVEIAHEFNRLKQEDI
jgi:hypothetical protein